MNSDINTAGSMNASAPLNLAEMEFSSKILNFENTGDVPNVESVFLTKDQGLFDTVNRRFPLIWDNLHAEMKALDWDEQSLVLRVTLLPRSKL